MRAFLSLTLLFVFLFSCKKKTVSTTVTPITKSTIKYAKGFDIVTNGTTNQLIIKKAHQKAKEHYTYTLGTKTNIKTNHLKTPIKNIVVTSTTHIAMLELLEVEQFLTGFPKTDFISSKKTRKRIDNGKIVDLGNEQSINTEQLIALSPELVVAFGVNGSNKAYKTALKNNIPVIYNGDWLEETPLGRAEWIKFFGVLFNKQHKADSIFNTIETNYLKVKKIAHAANQNKTIFSGSLYKDVWYMPAGNSFMATYFKDANTNYLWKNTSGTGSLPLSIESVLDKATNANYWIGCGLFKTKKELINSNKYYQYFNAFKQNNTYTYANKKGATGGLIYFENSPVRPDLVLKDIIKITNPDLFPDYRLTFFDKLK